MLEYGVAKGSQAGAWLVPVYKIVNLHVHWPKLSLTHQFVWCHLSFQAAVHGRLSSAKNVHDYPTMSESDEAAIVDNVYEVGQSQPAILGVELNTFNPSQPDAVVINPVMDHFGESNAKTITESTKLWKKINRNSSKKFFDSFC